MKIKDFKGVIYGTDDRVDVSTLTINSTVTARVGARLGLSVAAMIPKGNITSVENRKDYLKISGKKLRDSYELCPGERFADDLSIANCTGFLVGSDLLVTAGHCVESACGTRAVWAFGFNNTGKISDDIYIKTSNIYKCKEVLAREVVSNGADYALIRLDRKSNSPILKYRTSGVIPQGAPVILLGHPSGMPLKVTQTAAYNTSFKDDTFFRVPVDAFGGNSGSPVFNTRTFQVEGILVRGVRDYAYDQDKQCYRVNHCKTFNPNGPSGSCTGEDVTKITTLGFLRQLALFNRSF